MKKWVGYLISLIGLAILGAGSKIQEFKALDFLKNFGETAVLTAGVILVVVGVLFLRGEGKNKKSKEKDEVPIFEGKGKQRKVVGYQRE